MSLALCITQGGTLEKMEGQFGITQGRERDVDQEGPTD
jgi:hypothetical protein